VGPLGRAPVGPSGRAPVGLSGRVALVTGASRGIGAATARALDRDGARVVLLARDKAGLERTAAGLGNEPVVAAADLSEPDLAELVASILAQTGRIDVLVNNAAAAMRVPLPDLTAAQVDAMVAVNVRAALLLCAAALPGMAARGSGSIINVSSVSGLVGTPNRAAYAATKGAIDAMTRSLAIEYGPSGVRVNTVAPGVIDTDLWARNKAVPGVVEQVTAQIPLRRWGTPEDVADVIAFLASDAARYVTAQTIGVDGGLGRTLDLYGGPV
jgi:NAD(P)-dependent dehydrogenase (short-subunit alcohol dehydrogenase family)